MPSAALRNIKVLLCIWARVHDQNRSVWKAERTVICSKSTPSKIISRLTDLYGAMQRSLALGQLAQTMLFEGAARIQFPLRKSLVDENLSVAGPWPASSKQVPRQILSLSMYSSPWSHISQLFYLSICYQGKQNFVFFLCNSLLCSLCELLWKVVLVHGDKQSDWYGVCLGQPDGFSPWLALVR